MMSKLPVLKVMREGECHLIVLKYDWCPWLTVEYSAEFGTWNLLGKEKKIQSLVVIDKETRNSLGRNYGFIEINYSVDRSCDSGLEFIDSKWQIIN
jgi:hypothetical protein